jgi:hypothetical protein
VKTVLPTLPPIALDGRETADCAVLDGLIESVDDPAGATGWDAAQRSVFTARWPPACPASRWA